MDAGSTAGQQLDLGRLLPLGGPDDGTWITEQAAVRVLGRAAAEIPGVWLESLRIGSAPLEPVSEPAVRPPAGALPPGPLRIEAAFTASLGQPLPETAERLRSALLNAAAERLGLATVTADLRVTDLHEGPETGVKSRTATRNMRTAPEAAAARSSSPVPGTGSMRGPVGELAYVTTGVPGVARLTTVPGSRPVKAEEHDDPPGRHIEVQLAVAPGHHPLEVARAVRAAVTDAAARHIPGPVTTAVLITETAAWPGVKRQLNTLGLIRCRFSASPSAQATPRPPPDPNAQTPASVLPFLLSAPQRSPDQQEGRNADRGNPHEDHDCPDDDQVAAPVSSAWLCPGQTANEPRSPEPSP